MKRYFFFLFMMIGGSASAQVYADEIAAFKRQDSILFPAQNQILFIGSSSFRLLRDTTAIFPGYKILNRAFGGSTLQDVIYWRYETIYPYQPKQIVMYCGENDFGSSDTVTVEMVAQQFKTLFQLIRAKYPAVPFIYVSMKPSPSRKHLMRKIADANKLIQNYLEDKKQTHFIDVYKTMLRPDGSPRSDLFRADELHMNPKGYAIWKKIIQPYLLK